VRCASAGAELPEGGPRAGPAVRATPRPLISLLLYDRDQCYMNCDPISPPAAVGGCLTDWAISPALPMPYNGGRVAHASLACSLPDEGRGAYAK
jgi:hypothetical protein